MLIVGQPGSGKTLLSSTFPNTYYLSAEAGLMSVADRHIRGTKITESSQMKEVAMMLEQAREARSGLLGIEGPVDTVVLDTIDEIQQIYINERLRDEKLNALRPLDYGWLATEMKTILRRFRNLDAHVIWTCHEKKDVEQETSRVTYEPGLQGQISEWVPGAVDLALSLTARARPEVVGEKTVMVTHRKLQTYPDSQHPWVKDRSGKLPVEVDVNFVDDYDRISGHIFSEVPSVPAYQAAPLPQVEQVPEQEYNHKCSECNIGIPDDQAAISKIRFRTPLCTEHFVDYSNKGDK